MSNLSQIDAILVPGGGLDTSGQPSPWVLTRLDRAAELYRDNDRALLLTLSAGTVYKAPPLTEDGFPVSEAVAAARYLSEVHKIPADRIRTESLSLDTIGNAAFARWLLTDPNPAVRNLHIITSQFHMPRTKRIFEWIYSLQPGAARYCLSFESVPNTGLGSEELHARIEKEEKGLRSVETLANQFTTVEAFQEWLFTAHSAYSTAGLLAGHPKLPAMINRSY